MIRMYPSFHVILPTGPTMKRPGLSLLEVLVSVFILTVGLLSVVSLIPVGTHNMLQTTKLDRGSALARAAMREVKTMGLLDRHLWMDAAPLPPLATRSPIADQIKFGQNFAVCPIVPVIPFGGVATDPLLAQAFMIDPLGVARYYDDVNALGVAPTADILRFPFIPGLAVNEPSDQAHIPRLSIQPFTAAVTDPAVRRDFFERLFVCRNDALFHLPEERDLRPAAQFTFSDGSFSHELPDPQAAAGNAAIPIVGQAEGYYSWLMTATPVPSDTPAAAADLHTDHQRRYAVSTVVIYKRNFDFNGDEASADSPRAERRAFVQVLGGSDVRLLVPATDPNDPGPAALKLDKNEWLMLFAASPKAATLPVPVPVQKLDYDANPANNFYPGLRKVIHWYRVAGLDREPTIEKLADGNDYWTRYVTLAGPDWDEDTGVSAAVLSPLLPAGLTIDACAFLIDNVIAVRTTEMEIE